ncbi:MAG: Omp28-related outer membrane protein [bacterium]
MLDQICNDYAGYVVAVEWHISSSYPLYSPEGRAKWYMYPPPYNGAYATPWLWVDGRQRGYNYNLWAGYVAARITEPTPVQITLSGNYDPASRNGTIRALIQNDSTDTLIIRISVVITEDSCYYVGPNGDPWHNHVCRDYIPNQTGTVLTISPGGIDSVEQPFTIATNWNEQRCKIVVYAQSTTMVPADSSYPVYQGAQVAVLDLVSVQEPRTGFVHQPAVQVMPNPATANPVFAISAGPNQHYRLNIYTVDGRGVCQLNGIVNHYTRVTLPAWLGPGVYFYQLKVDERLLTGKLSITR